jgi:DNA-binding response OmpR family regulator
VTTRFADILLVEDDDTLSRVIGRNLSARGITVRRVSSVAEALSAITARVPSALLLDIELPDRTGWDLLRVLHSRGIDLPTIVVTATRVTPDRLAEFHPIAYIPKPFPLEALLRLVVGEERSTVL